MALPDFIFVGPDKSGSTWLYSVLLQHPQVYLPKTKEIFFFDKNYNKGLDWYKSFFPPNEQSFLATGEFCHDYLTDKNSPRRIWENLPNAKLMVSLRNPIDRAISQWRFRCRNGLTADDFDRDIRLNPEILEASKYDIHIKRYLRYFPKRQIYFIRFEFIKTKPEHVFDELSEFISVDRAFFQQPLSEAYSNSAKRARNPRTVKMLRKVAHQMRHMGMYEFVSLLKYNEMAQAILFKQDTTATDSLISHETRKRLCDLYAPHNVELENLIGTHMPELWH